MTELRPQSRPGKAMREAAELRRPGAAATAGEGAPPGAPLDASTLAGVIEATDLAIWEWDIPGDRIRVNERWARLLGRRVADLQPVTSRRFLELVHPQDVPAVEAAIAAHFDGEATSYDCEMRMRHANGEWVWLHTRGRVISRRADGSPARASGIHLPIDARKRQEQRLQRSQQLLETTGRIAGVGGWEIDLPSGRLTWTDQTKRIHGVPLDYEPTVDEAVAFYAPEARPVILAAVRDAMERGADFDVELPLVRADGQRIWVRSQGSVETRDGRAVRVFGAFCDITDRRALTDALAEKNELLHVTLESIGDAVITTDPAGVVTWMNPVAEQLTGVPLAEARGGPLARVFAFVHQDTREPVESPVSRCLAAREVVSLARETVLLSRDGSEYAVEDSAAPIVNADGELLGAVMVFYDVTEQRRMAAEMAYRARHDALTGLHNRSEFEHRLEGLLQEAREAAVEHALLYLDLDQFKIVNDTCGHTAGDELLVQMSQLLRDSLGADDFAARLGGDEFAIVLERCDATRAEQLAADICEKARAQRFVHGDQRFRIGASVGLVMIHGDWPTPAAIMQAADRACYAAKEAGRDRVHRYLETDAAIRSHQSRTRWALRIEEALEHDRFVLHAQRISALDDADDGTRRMELLLRLDETDGNGLVMPGAFIPAAERFNLMPRIDRWVLERAIELAAPAPVTPCEIFVNLSGQSLGDRGFQDEAIAALTRLAPAVAGALVFEVTETEVIANLADARRFLRTVRRLGVRVALDDFGAGMASYGYLRSLDFDYLKIDGQLISTMCADPLSLAVVRSFIDIAGVLGLPVIAEHVEDEQTLAALRGMGVAFAQGYRVHRPAPVAAVARGCCCRTRS